MPSVLTATQLIYSGTQGLTGEYEPSESCHICGGLLFLPYKKVSELSANWTDGNLCRRLDSGKICIACSWFTAGKNRSLVWGSSPVFCATENGTDSLTVPEFYSLLKSGFTTPAVFMMRGRDSNLTRKHVQWRVLDSVTYDPKSTKVLFYGLQLWKEPTGLTIGTATFDSHWMLSVVESMMQTSSPYLEQFISNKKKVSQKKVSQWFVQNFVMQNLLAALMDKMTPELFLGSYIASHTLAKEVVPDA